jgi:alkaline phosphatase D
MKKLLLLLFVGVISTTLFHAQENRNALRAELAPFFHGVASGDPLHDRVIIWTRVTPEEVNNDPIEVSWRVALDTNMTDVVTSGSFVTDQSRDYTVKVDVTGLNPSTCYYYDFEVNASFSAVGRMLTADSGPNENVRFAVVSCSNYQYGFFNAYRAIANRNDINAVLHLGDYIYEYGAGGYSANIDGRDHEPENEIVTLEDYRLRYSHYRLDHDLQEIHRQYPFICVWDDHESANDSWVDGAENHDPATQGPWLDRKNNSIQAYFEWLPIRENAFDNSIYRKIEYGDLINLYMLDTRLEGRDEQVGVTSSSLNDPSRSLLGQTQKDWLKDELLNSGAQWNILGQQVMMAPLLAFGVPVNADQWDGYQAERTELLNYIVNNDIENVVVLTGDIHTSWAMDVPVSGYVASTGENSAAVEFVTTSVTSPGFPIGFGVSLIQSFNPHIKWIDLTKRGYMILDIDQNRTQSEWYFMDDINTQNSNESFANAWYVNSGERFVRNATGPTVSPVYCDPAPSLSLETLSDEVLTLYGVYPNPFDQYFILHFGSQQPQHIEVAIYDMSGKEVFRQKNIPVMGGSEYYKIYTADLPQGVYQLHVITEKGQTTHKLMK